MNNTIHKSPVLLAFKIVVLEILVEVAYLAITAAVSFLAQQLGYELRLLSPLTQILLLPVQIGVLVYILTKWSSETYEIKEEELIMNSGVLKRTSKAYPYRNMQTVTVRQSVFERLVGVGSVSVFVPTLGSELVFLEVPNPNQFAERIKQAIPDAGNSQFIMRK